MKKLLLIGTALLSLCSFGQTARAGGDDRDYSYRRSYRDDGCEERRVVVRRYYREPRVCVDAFPLPLPPLPRIIVRGGDGCDYPRPYYHRRHHHPHLSFFLGF